MNRSIAIHSLAGLVVAAALGASIAGANAGDRAYADSFGNLVVYAQAGYKRIVVGAGELAPELNDYQRGSVQRGPPAVIYGDEDRRTGNAERACYRPPVLVKGRAYMYGFDEGEIPLQGGACR